MSLRFLDTNILLYAVSRESEDQAKRRIALELIQPMNWRCSGQVLQEFYANAIKRHKNGISPSAASELVERFVSCAVVATDADLVQHGIDLHQKHQLSYWDAAIIAAALRSGADELLTEDMNAGQVIEGVRIVNPFV